MKVKELIELLGQQDPELDVFVAYDSMVCISDLGRSDCFLFEVGKDPEHDYPTGLYLCAGINGAEVGYQGRSLKG